MGGGGGRGEKLESIMVKEVLSALELTLFGYCKTVSVDTMATAVFMNSAYPSYPSLTQHAWKSVFKR